MIRTPVILLIAACLPCSAMAQYTTKTHTDEAGDAVLRRTDTGADGLLRPDTLAPDLLELRLSGWNPSGAPADPFTGSFILGESAHVFRLDADFAGVINPPGTVGLGGLPYDPFRYGPSPLLGFIELDTDHDKDTGGQLGGAANLRFLANVGRFGARPEGSIGERAARSASDLDGAFWTEPQVERSGEDFALVMCGCHDVYLISEGGDGDGLFEAGETWIVRSRFFQRAAGYRDASAVFGGSAGGLYDPWVNLRFSHNPASDVTTVSLVFALTPAGAAALTGQPMQPIDLNAGNHASVQEAVQDLIDAADGSLSGPVRTLTERWEGEHAYENLDPTHWKPTALIGTAYAAEEDALYVWTDIGFDSTVGDFNGDRLLTDADTLTFDQFLSSTDGSPSDADGTANGAVAIIDFGYNFSLFDLDGNGSVDSADRAMLSAGCPADFNGDGVSNVFDLLAYLTLWFAGDPGADMDADLTVTVFDLLAFLSAWFAGC